MRIRKILFLLFTSLICFSLWSQIALSNGTCDAAFEIPEGVSCQTESAAAPQSILDAITNMRARFSLLYVDTMNTILIGSMDANLVESLNQVKDRFILFQVDARSDLPISYPAALVNDQTPPEFDRSPSSKVRDDGRFIIAWTSNEFTNGTLRFGTQSGNYTSQAVQTKYYKRNEVITTDPLDPGTLYYGQVEIADLSGNTTTSLEFTFGAKSGKPLVLIYAGMDNNLGDDPDSLHRLISNVEQGVHQGISVRFFLDGPAENDSYIYAVSPGMQDKILPGNLTCVDPYVEGVNCWKAQEDSAHPFALYEFIKNAVDAHQVDHGTETQILLSIVGHGSGWTANILPGQPSGWDAQPSGWDAQPENNEFNERLGGLLWDDKTGNGNGTSRSLSTKGLGQALKWVQNDINRTIDLIYFDACSMGMAEVAYEVRDASAYMLASPNTAWSSFAYAGMLAQVSGSKTTQDIAGDWIAAEAAALNADLYPFTLALYDLGEMDELAEAVNKLSARLISLMNSYRSEMKLAHSEAERYESDYNGAIDRRVDNYADFGSFGAGIRSKVPGDSEFRKLVSNMQNQVKAVIKDTHFQNGNPWNYPSNDWQWTDKAEGLGIYLPLEVDEPKRKFYNADNLAWAADTQWDEFLAAYWGDTVLAAGEELLPVCESTRGCTTLEQVDEVTEVDPDYLPPPVATAVVTDTPTPQTPTPEPTESSTPEPTDTLTPKPNPAPTDENPDGGSSQELYLPVING